MPREALKDQRTIPLTRFPREDMEKVTKRQVDFLRSMLAQQMPHARVVKVERTWRERKTSVGGFLDLLTIVWFEHDGRPLPEKMKRLRDFNVLEKHAAEAHAAKKRAN